MNITGRFAYFFQVIFGWFVRCYEEIANIINNNPFLKELLKYLTFFIIGFLAFAILRWLFLKYLGE